MDIQSFFNSAAFIWDKNSSSDLYNILTTLRLSDLREGMDMMDVGCGTGVMLPYMLEYEPNRILAIDFAENMINLARSKLSDKRINYICKDFFDISSDEYKCDFCIFYNSFFHFTDHKALIRHLSPLIKTGGRITISHTQGKKLSLDSGVSPGMPATGIINVLKPYFRPDVIIDNNVMFMVSAVKLNR